jgi:hypothetical protein
MNSYAGLSELKTYWDFTAGQADDLNDTLRDYLIRASRGIDRYTRKKFYPYKRTLWFDVPDDERTINVRDFFLEVLGLSSNAGTAGNGAIQVIPEDVQLLRCGENWNLTPYNTIEIEETSGSLLNWSGSRKRAVKVELLMGFRSDYQLDDEPWLDSGTCLLADLSSSTSVIVAGASNGANELGISPRFASEQIWRLGSGASQELVYVLNTGVGASPAQQTGVLRGVNGTTATSHASGTPIELWQPEPEIKINTMRLARWYYEVRNNPTGQRHFFPQMGGFELADTWPKDIRDALDRYVGVDIWGF